MHARLRAHVCLPVGPFAKHLRSCARGAFRCWYIMRCIAPRPDEGKQSTTTVVLVWVALLTLTFGLLTALCVPLMLFVTGLLPYVFVEQNMLLRSYSDLLCSCVSRASFPSFAVFSVLCCSRSRLLPMMMAVFLAMLCCNTACFYLSRYHSLSH